MFIDLVRNRFHFAKLTPIHTKEIIMDWTIINHIAYLVITIPTIIWVGNRLHTHGRQFVIDAFHGDEERGTAVNNLFHWLLFGQPSLMALFLRFGEPPTTAIETVELVGTKIGIVLLVLGPITLISSTLIKCVAKPGPRTVGEFSGKKATKPRKETKNPILMDWRFSFA